MKDIQGVNRGRCNKCRDCAEYTTGDGGSVRCVCGHTPSDHEKQSAAAPSRQSTSSSEFSSDHDFPSRDGVTASSCDLCPYPGCNQPVEFDLNTGVQGETCSLHWNMEVAPLTLSVSPLALNDFSRIGKRHRDKAAYTCIWLPCTKTAESTKINK